MHDGSGGIAHTPAPERQLAESRSAPARGEDLNRVVLDSLPAHVAVLDSDGRILITNRSWRQFQTENGGTAESCGIGTNYLDVCGNAVGVGNAPEAEQVAAG